MKSYNMHFPAMEVEEKIDMLAACMAGCKKERRELARCGAVRLTRREAAQLFSTEAKLHQYYVHLVESQ
eukprot:12471731-Heterocapsa_arctica.AAC.1